MVEDRDWVMECRRRGLANQNHHPLRHLVLRRLPPLRLPLRLRALLGRRRVFRHHRYHRDLGLLLLGGGRPVPHRYPCHLLLGVKVGACDVAAGPGHLGDEVRVA